MASTNGRESSKMTASVDSLKLSSKATSKNSSKHASSESVLSKKEKECLQMQECKKKLLAMEPQVIIRDDNMVLRSPPQKKIVMPPTINPEVRFIYNYQIRSLQGPVHSEFKHPSSIYAVISNLRVIINRSEKNITQYFIRFRSLPFLLFPDSAHFFDFLCKTTKIRTVPHKY